VNAHQSPNVGTVEIDGVARPIADLRAELERDREADRVALISTMYELAAPAVLRNAADALAHGETLSPVILVALNEVVAAISDSEFP